MIGGAAKYLLFILAAVAIAVLLPVIIPLAAFLVWRDNARMKRIARTTHCPQCGELLGDDAIERGDAAWRDVMAELNQGADLAIRRRIVRTIDAVCGHCGTACQFISQTGRFVVAAPMSQAPAAPPAPVRAP